MQIEEWEVISRRFFAYFPSTSIRPEHVAAFYSVLRDLPSGDVANAARTFLERAITFPPSAPEFREQAVLEGAPRREWMEPPLELDARGVAALMDKPLQIAGFVSERGPFDPPPMRKLTDGDR